MMPSMQSECVDVRSAVRPSSGNGMLEGLPVLNSRRRYPTMARFTKGLDMTDEAYCCFCFATAPQDEMFRLFLSPPGEKGDERSQMMVCHGTCLDRALHPEMWRHPDLLDE